MFELKAVTFSIHCSNLYFNFLFPLDEKLTVLNHGKGDATLGWGALGPQEGIESIS
jgi:hypothetical protein